MPVANTANIKQWLEQSNIDFFTCFVKAWIPFNAWYRHNYDSREQEREILDLIKSDSNRIRTRFIAGIDSTDRAWQEMRNHIGVLHRRLSNDPLVDKKKRTLSFEKVLIGPNPQRFAEHKHGHWTYRVERIAKMQVDCTITSSHGREACKITQPSSWSLEELESNADYLALQPNDRSLLRSCYEAASPYRFASLLAPAASQSGGTLAMGEYHFVTDKAAIFAGLVEVLYSMRNLLFHGEIVPDAQTNRTYEPAFHLVRHLISSAQ